MALRITFFRNRLEASESCSRAASVSRSMSRASKVPGVCSNAQRASAKSASSSNSRGINRCGILAGVRSIRSRARNRAGKPSRAASRRARRSAGICIVERPSITRGWRITPLLVGAFHDTAADAVTQPQIFFSACARRSRGSSGRAPASSGATPGFWAADAAIGQ